MKSRIITGLFIASAYVVFLIIAIYVDGLVGKILSDLFVVVLMIVSGIEMSNAISTRFGRPIIAVLILNVLIGYLCFAIVNNIPLLGGLNSGGVFAFFGQLIVIFFLCMIYTMIAKRDLSAIFSTMFVLIYPASLMVFMIANNYLDRRIMAICLMIFVSSGTDVFAYFVGRTVGGAKLASSISPNKTVSGSVGGLLGGVLGAMFVLILGANDLFKIQIFEGGLPNNIVHFTMIGLVGSGLNQFGDLVASFVKRACGVKDYGSFMPGHGGVLDRVDGMMLLAMFVFVYISFYEMFFVVI
ncbi:MAG: phosphatidate cytidylyltransferase [Clostridiales bacterium]|jgi:phosphatidate cytidylyltransferase|nr:phosphatidate cytidylyltransferase [Clostridiales bacterium]